MRAQSSDEEELRRCFEQYWNRVVRYLHRRGADAYAEDLAAEAFAIAWSRWPDVPATPLPWLLKTAGYCWANERRRLQRAGILALELRPVMREDPAFEDYAERQTTRAVLAAVAALGDKEREALILTAWDGLSTRDAAEVLDCSTSALKVRLHRARNKVRRAVERDETPVPARTCDPVAARQREG